MHIIVGAVIFGFMLYFSIAVCSAGKEADRAIEEYFRKMNKEKQQAETNISKGEVK